MKNSNSLDRPDLIVEYCKANSVFSHADYEKNKREKDKKALVLAILGVVFLVVMFILGGEVW